MNTIVNFLVTWGSLGLGTVLYKMGFVDWLWTGMSASGFITMIAGIVLISVFINRFAKDAPPSKYGKVTWILAFASFLVGTTAALREGDLAMFLRTLVPSGVFFLLWWLKWTEVGRVFAAKANRVLSPEIFTMIRQKIGTMMEKRAPATSHDAPSASGGTDQASTTTTKKSSEGLSDRLGRMFDSEALASGGSTTLSFLYEHWRLVFMTGTLLAVLWMYLNGATVGTQAFVFLVLLPLAIIFALKKEKEVLIWAGNKLLEHPWIVLMVLGFLGFKYLWEVEALWEIAGTLMGLAMITAPFLILFWLFIPAGKISPLEAAKKGIEKLTR